MLALHDITEIEKLARTNMNEAHLNTTSLSTNMAASFRVLKATPKRLQRQKTIASSVPTQRMQEENEEDSEDDTAEVGEDKSPEKTVTSMSKRSTPKLSKSGWLYKKGGVNTAYQHRYFALKEGVLSWYADQQAHEAGKLKGSVSCFAIEIEPDAGKDDLGRFCFAIKAVDGSSTRWIELACEDANERDEWVQVLQNAEATTTDDPRVSIADKDLVTVAMHDIDDGIMPERVMIVHTREEHEPTLKKLVIQFSTKEVSRQS